MVAIASGDIDDSLLEFVTAASSGSATEASAPTAAAAPPAVNEKLPSMGWASPARTLHRTPTTPPASAGSNVRRNTLPSSEVTDDGWRTWPVGSSTTKPSPASVETPVNSIVIVSTGSPTTAPSAGSEPTKLV